MTGDFILSLSRRMEDKMASTGRLHIIKNRFGQDGDTFPIEFDTSTGASKVHDPDSDSGKAILARMNNSNAEENVQEILKNSWNKHKANGGGGTNRD